MGVCVCVCMLTHDRSHGNDVSVSALRSSDDSVCTTLRSARSQHNAIMITRASTKSATHSGFSEH
jgi:hypothetical protein